MAATRHQLTIIGQQPGAEGRANKYDPEMCMQIRLLAQEGKFPEQWCGPLAVSLDTMRRWRHQYPDFRDALIIARILLNAYWSQKAHDAIEKPGINQAVLITILKGRFPEFYGNNPVDVWHFLHSEDGAWRPPVDTSPADAAGLSMNLTETEVKMKLAALRARREAEKKE